MEALCPAQRGSSIAPSRHGMLTATAAAALLDVFLEARRQRQPVDQVKANTAEDGELAEVTQRLHAAQPRQRSKQADRRRRQAGTSRSQVVQTSASQRLGDGRLDELGDSGAAVTLRLSVETEHTCTHEHPQRLAIIIIIIIIILLSTLRPLQISE